MVELKCGAEDYLGFLKTRRSIRRYEEKEVPDEIIMKAIEVSRFAPSAHNSQPWLFILVKDKEKIEELARIHQWTRPLLRAKKAVVIFADKEASPTSYLIDGANAAIYFHLALHAQGVGTVWIQAVHKADEIRKVLKVPENFVPVGIFPVGYPAERPGPRPRKDVSEIVCINEYCK